MSSRFGDMLLNRRRQLGMSIQQVANVIKIRPQIIEYFETANFAAMPPRGYAQGMISSYARFLGLNPREVVEAYFDELYTYERVNNTGAGRFQESVAEASPHSENPTGRFMMVNAAPPSRYGQRPPQAGYVSESHSPHEPVSASRLRSDARGNTGMYRGQRSLPPAGGPGNHQPRPARSQVPQGQRRRPMPQDGVPYRAGGNGTGLVRAQAPHRAPLTEQGRGPRQGGYGQRPRGQVSRGRGGRPVTPASPFYGMDNRILIGGAAIIVILLLIIAMLALKGCAPTQKAPAGSAVHAQAVDKGSKGDTADDADVDDDVDPQTADGDAPATPANPDQTQAYPQASQQPKETKVKISIAKGKTSWVEVKLDGVGKFADTVVGPFSQEYTVTQSIEISVTNPADVDITLNGEKVRYDSKSSGVGRVTINAPKPPEPVDADGDGKPDQAVPADQQQVDEGGDAPQTAGA